MIYQKEPTEVRKITNSNILKNIRGNGYSRLLTLFTTPTEIERLAPKIIRNSNMNSPFIYRRNINNSAYKMNNTYENSPDSFKKSANSLGTRNGFQSHGASIDKSRCFPKRSLNYMYKRYSNFKSVKSSVCDYASISISRLVASPPRARARAKLIRYTQNIDSFSRTIVNKSFGSESSSNAWETMEAKNIEPDYK